MSPGVSVQSTQATETVRLYEAVDRYPKAFPCERGANRRARATPAGTATHVPVLVRDRKDLRSQKTKRGVGASIKSRLLQPVIYTWQLLRWAAAKSWRPSKHRGPGRKISTTERITESYFNVMENRINQLEEKSHIFHRKSSMKLVLYPRRKGTDSQGASRGSGIQPHHP